MTNPHDPTPAEVYSLDEVAQAAGVPASAVEALVSAGGIHAASPLHPFLRHDQAVIAVRTLRATGTHNTGSLRSADIRCTRPRACLWPVSSTFHAGIAAAIVFISTVGFPQASTRDEVPLEKVPTRLVVSRTARAGRRRRRWRLAAENAAPARDAQRGRSTSTARFPCAKSRSR
jgi:hypothetical protein